MLAEIVLSIENPMYSQLGSIWKQFQLIPLTNLEIQEYSETIVGNQTNINKQKALKENIEM